MLSPPRFEVDLRWIPVSAAAKLLLVSRQRVYQLIDAGALVAQSVDGTVLVSQRSIEARIALLREEGVAFDGYGRRVGHS